MLIALLAFALLGLTACGADGEKENIPGAAPAPAPPVSREMVKPTVAGTKLIPKVVTASKTDPGGDPPHVSDGDVMTSWNAGDRAPQWILIDLGAPTSISDILLNPNQTPDGPSTHRLYGGPTPDNLKLLGTLDGNTQNNQWIEHKVAANDIRYLKIETVTSPSWVSWREIEIYK